MSDYIVKDTELTSVANAIRTKGGTNSQLVFPGGFVSAIGNISGGGGSSDFSTAQVTVTRTEQKTIFMPFLLDGEHSAIMSSVEDSGVYTAVLYKGVCVASALNLGNPMIAPTVAVTGNATSEGFEIIITGDCTITIS